MRRLVKVTAELCAPLALSPDGSAPHLDAICESVMARKAKAIAESRNGHRHSIDTNRPRGQPVRMPGQLPIPIIREKVGGLPIPRCSQGIIEQVKEQVSHYHCAFPLDRAGMLTEKQRTTIATTGGSYKSIRLPLRLVDTARVVWFAELRESPSKLRRILKRVPAIGKKTSQGYGVVTSWAVELTDIDAAWFCGGVLMRPLPLSAVPADILGKRRGFGAVCGPYWQADLFVERWEVAVVV